MQTKTKKLVNVGRLIDKIIVFGTISVAIAGCVAEYPEHYYSSYPNDYTYYDYNGRPVVVVHDRDNYYYRDDDHRRHYHDYDNKWDYGRRGNGNFHGTDRDDVHDD